MKIEVHVTDANTERVERAFAAAFPQPQGQQPVDPQKWVNICAQRFVIGTVAKYEQAIKQQAIQLEPDTGIVDTSVG
jgi:hypothetical protein